MRRHIDSRLRGPLGAALLAGAIAAAPAAAQAPTPDSIDRNLDATKRHALEARGVSGVTPDAADAADGRYLSGNPTPVIVRITRTQPDSLDWGDVAIGAGGTLGVVLVATGGTLTLARRRGHVRVA